MNCHVILFKDMAPSVETEIEILKKLNHVSITITYRNLSQNMGHVHSMSVGG